jgi:outer membrane protein W
MKKITTLFILIVLFAASQSFAQMLPVPKVTVHVFGGYGMPTGNFKQELPTTERADADYFPYYTKQLINFGADGKLALGTRGNFRVTLGATYNMFSNDGTTLLRPGQGQAGVSVNFKPKVNIMSIALGGEWAFAPTQKVNPYVGLGVAGNFFSGKFEFGQSVYVKGAQRTGPMDMKSETRIGIILDAGADFRLSRTVGAVLGVKYHFINPIGKGADDESEIGANEIDLGDQEHLDGTNYFPSRTVSSVNVYAGVSFYFGLMK